MKTTFISAILIVLISVPIAKAETMEVIFTPTFFKCSYSPNKPKTCTCYDQACNLIPCPTLNPPPWPKGPPPCPHGKACAQRIPNTTCRLEGTKGRAVLSYPSTKPLK